MSNAASVPASTALSAKAGLMPISWPAGRTGISVVASEAWPDGSLTPTVIDAFSACVVSGRARDGDGQRRMALRVGVRHRQVLGIGRVGLVDQADAIAGQRRERRRIDHQPHLRLAGQAGGGRAIQEARGDRQRIGLAGDDRRLARCRVRPPCGRARRHRRGTPRGRSAAGPDRPSPRWSRCRPARRSTA